MANVQFDEDHSLDQTITTIRRLEEPKKAFMGFLLHSGLAKTEKQANIEMIIFCIVCIISAALIYYFSGFHSPTHTFTVEELRQMTQPPLSPK